MKNILVISALFLFISGNALAESEYDTCIQEEKDLKAREITSCKGLSYLLNPSACFATQKALKEYSAGKCKKTGMTGNADVNVQKIMPEKKALTADIPVNSIKKKTIEIEVPQQAVTTNQLKDENARLRAEINRLKAENEQLKKQAGNQGNTPF